MALRHIAAFLIVMLVSLSVGAGVRTVAWTPREEYLRALRSGEYIQGHGINRLVLRGEEKFCAMGLAWEILRLRNPHLIWAPKREWCLQDKTSDLWFPYSLVCSVESPVFSAFYGGEALFDDVGKWNDRDRKPFTEIADKLEARWALLYGT